MSPLRDVLLDHHPNDMATDMPSTHASSADAGPNAEPALTIITSVLNGDTHLEPMLASMPLRSDVEHLVIDAGSTDKSVEKLRAQPGINLISRPGMSLYDAWNVALAEMRGGGVWFVNSDDLLPPGAVESVLDGLARHPEVEILQGRSEAFRNEDCSDTLAQAHPYPDSVLNLVDLVFGAPVINARVFRRSVIDYVGPFNPSYRFAADREWLLRLAMSESPPVVCMSLDLVVYRYRIHARSMTLKQSARRRLATAQEHRRIAARAIEDFERKSEGASATLRMLRAWHSRETVAGIWSAGRAGRLGLASRLAVSLLVTLSASLGRLASSRRWRRAYLERAATATRAASEG